MTARPRSAQSACVLSVLREGEPLGPYLLERKIAVGGMAEVWSAVLAGDRQNRKFALKILLENLSKDRTLRAMFADEVRIAQRLRHPNIVRVESEMEDRGFVFLAMELIDGKDLRRLLADTVKNRAEFPLALATLIARDAARGLGYAHGAQGDDGQPLLIVHRDVSPHNIMIDREGQVRVLDFGVARARERITRTAAGVIKGKISYMSPEQMMAGDVTAQSDIFSLGIVLWEMLALRRLFGMASDAEVITAVCEARVPSLRAINPKVPQDLADLVGQMLKLHPKERPETMRIVENGLSRVLSTCFGEEESSHDALAAWMVPQLDQPRRKTAVMPGRGGPGGPPTHATEVHHAMLPTVGVVVPPVEDAAGAPTEAITVGEGFADALRDDPTHTTPADAALDLTDTRPDPANELALGKTQPYSAEKQAELADTLALQDLDPSTPVALRTIEDPTHQDLSPADARTEGPRYPPKGAELLRAVPRPEGSGETLKPSKSGEKSKSGGEGRSRSADVPGASRSAEGAKPSRSADPYGSSRSADVPGASRSADSPGASRSAEGAKPSRSADRPRGDLPPLPKGAPLPPLPPPPQPLRREIPSELHRAVQRAEEPRSGRFAWVAGTIVVLIGGLFLLARACGL